MQMLQKAQPPGGQGAIARPATPGHSAWVVRVEHWCLRVMSLIFSIGSAYAIAQVFAPAAGGVIRQAVDFGIAGGFGVLGFFLSRGLAYRLFQKEAVWSYLPICLIVEFVEVFCNYVMGASEVPHEVWLQQIPLAQRPGITNMAYVVLSIIPAVTLFLAVMDMDLERRKHVQASGSLSVKSPSPSTYPGTAPSPMGQGTARPPVAAPQTRPNGQRVPGAAPVSPMAQTTPVRPGIQPMSPGGTQQGLPLAPGLLPVP